MSIECLSALQAKPRTLRRLVFSSAIVIALVALGGCGEVARPVVGQITITDANGVSQPPIISVKRGTSINLDVIVTNDSESLGVDWTVTCGSSAPEGSLPPGTVDMSCGSFLHGHTTSGPIPSYPLPEGMVIVNQYTAPANVPTAGTVTIVAHATSLPSRTSSITLTIT